MAKYQLTAPAFIDSAFRAIGEEIEFDGLPGPHMRPLDKAAEAAQAEPRESSDSVFTGFYGFSGEREPPPPTSLPEMVDVPYVSGDGVVGATLNCTMGNWNWMGEPSSYAYQWMANGITVSTEGDSYVIAAGDAGKSVTCMVTATNAVGSTQAPHSNVVLVEAARSTEGRTRR